MFNPFNLISKIIKDGNQKELDRIQKIIHKINNFEKATENLKDSEFPKKTLNFIESLKSGKTINDILPETFALVREA